MTYLPQMNSQHSEQTRSILYRINESMALTTGGNYLKTLVKNMSENLDVPHILIGLYEEKENSIITKAFWSDNKYIENFSYNLSCTPCELVIKEGRVQRFGKGVQDLFPKDKDLVDLSAESYIGLPLMGGDNEVIGHIVVMDTKPMWDIDFMESLLQLYAARISFELEKINHKKTIQEKDLQYELLFENAFDGIMIFHIYEGRMVSWNRKFCEYLKTTDEEIRRLDPGAYMPKFQPDGRGSVDVATDYLRIALEKGKVQYEFVHQARDGELYHTETTVCVLPEPSSHLAVYIYKEINARKKAEEELKTKNIQLEKYIDSNLQLENFAYIASHDMKEPLRTIGNFTQLLKRRYKDKFDEEGEEFLEFIISGVKSMNRLINDVLSYSRVNSQEYDLEEVNLVHLLFNITNNLRETIRETEAELIIGDMPETIKVNKTSCTQLFQNLIVNALKFHQQDKKNIIEVGSKRREKDWLFWVKDNGIGIAPEYHNRIFVLFKKLHNKSEYIGTGIGLALCKKIVEKHNGEMWVESELGKGATFYFILPD